MRYSDAVMLCEKILPLAPKDYDVYETYCLSLLKLHRWKEAIASSKKWGEVVGQGPSQLRVLVHLPIFLS